MNNVRVLNIDTLALVSYRTHFDGPLLGGTEMVEIDIYPYTDRHCNRHYQTL